MKNSADLGGCYPPRPSASVDNTLLDLQNSSYPTRPHSIIAKYTMMAKPMKILELHYSMIQFLCGLHEVYSHIMASSDLFIYSTRVERLSRDLVS